MRIYRSNSAEKLLTVLTDLVRVPAGSPFEPECIVVQSSGMATWLSMNLSRALGIWGNPNFPHPRQLVQRILRATLGEEGDKAQTFVRERLVFCLMKILPGLLAEKAFQPLRYFLENDVDGHKLLQLSQRIAYVFDQYAIYRPEMVLDWENRQETGKNDDYSWQRLLWLKMVGHLGAFSPAGLMGLTLERLHSGTLVQAEHLPPRIILFGIASLPPVYVHLLGALANLRPVYFFLLSPSEEYWSDIRSQQEIHRIYNKHGAGLTEISLQYVETGNPLLASLGILGRDFHHLIEETVDYEEPLEGLYEVAEFPQTLLEVLQHDIVRLKNRNRKSPDVPQPLVLADRSIEIHACYSKLRELEVLHDHLLSLLTEENGIKPHNIIVMVPEIEAYAPLIEAVFERSAKESTAIPYSIADRPAMNNAPVIEAFLQIMALTGERITASRVMDLLAVEPIQKRFGIPANDLGQIKTWIAESGIRWGLDEQDRAVHHQPADRQNTWEFGLDRLVLGYALPDGDQTIFYNVVPYDAVEGQAAELLGAFMHFCETLFAQLKTLSESRSLTAWQATVSSLLDALFAHGYEENWQHQIIRDALAEISADAEGAGFDNDVDNVILQKLLQERLTASPRKHGFLAGGVTFCELLPMRSIPFKVICMLGLNDGEFPRQQFPSSFDLVAQNPKLGDRSRRNDDRYLFLEAILAARKKLYLSYVGMSIKDGSAMPPSVVVDELLDCIADSFYLDEQHPDEDSHRRKIVERLVVKHPLQPFSASYFAKQDQDHRLFSYAENYCAAVEAQHAGRRQKPPFLQGPLESEVQQYLTLSLQELQRFFSLPARWFLQQNLSLFLDEWDDELEDREPVSLDNLEKYQIGAQLLAVEKIEDSPHLLAMLRGQGVLPLGVPGRIQFNEIYESVQGIRQTVNALGLAEKLKNLPLDLKLANDVAITGEIIGRYPVGLIRTTPVKLKERLYLAAWLEHLCLCLASPEDQQLFTYLVGKGEDGGSTARFVPVQQPASILENLISLYKLGQQQPLLFFPKSSFEFASALRSGRGDEEERRKRAAANAWKSFYLGVPSLNLPPEGAEPHIRRLFGETDPLKDGRVVWHKKDAKNDFESLANDFESLSEAIFISLLEHLEQVS